MTQHSICSPVSETEFFLWLEPAVEAMCLWKTFVSSQCVRIIMIVANILHLSPSPDDSRVWSPEKAEIRVACRTLRSIHFQTRRLKRFHTNRTEPTEKIQTGVFIKWKAVFKNLFLLRHFFCHVTSWVFACTHAHTLGYDRMCPRR